jgi:geranylgeranylglycerol-phosphate geranylgeranyltransferase
VVLGEIMALGCLPATQQVTLGFTSSFLLTASSFVLNDYLDVEVDRVNCPDRPIPAGLVSERSALLYGIILAVTGSVLPMLLGPYPFVIALLTFLLSVWYSLSGKQTGLLGNMTVAFCVAQPFPYGAIISTGSLNITVVMIFLLTFLSNAGREVANGIADAEGDATKNVRSVAIIYGPKAAALLASVFFILTAITGPIIFWWSSGSLGNLDQAILPIAVAEIGFVYSSVRLIRNPNRDAALSVTRQINMWMIIIVISFLAQHLIKQTMSI